MAQWQVAFVVSLLYVGLSVSTDVADGWMNDVQDIGRELQATPRPCRWNTNFGSCDFNYDYVVSLKTTNPASGAARQWFINAKSCDSGAYQRSQVRCEGDNTHFCRWVGGTGSVKCIAVLQELYNYKLACTRSVAKDHFFCKNKFTKNNCLRFSGCRWFAPAGRAPYCRAFRLTSMMNTNVNSAALTSFRAAWGKCPGSDAAFNQTICSKQHSKTACVRAKYCTWGVFSTGGVCYTSDKYSAKFLYGDDPGFKYLLTACAKNTKATCEAVVAPTAATRLASLDG